MDLSCQTVKPLYFIAVFDLLFFGLIHHMQNVAYIAIDHRKVSN